MVFERTAKPLLPGVLDGYNATVFAYGVSELKWYCSIELMFRRQDVERHIRLVDKKEKRVS